MKLNQEKDVYSPDNKSSQFVKPKNLLKMITTQLFLSSSLVHFIQEKEWSITTHFLENHVKRPSGLTRMRLSILWIHFWYSEKMYWNPNCLVDFAVSWRILCAYCVTSALTILRVVRLKIRTLFGNKRENWGYKTFRFFLLNHRKWTFLTSTRFLMLQ